MLARKVQRLATALALAAMAVQPLVLAAQTYHVQVPFGGARASNGQPPDSPAPLAVTVSPASLDFSGTRVGQAPVQQVTLTNTGDEAVAVAGVSAPPGSGFSIVGACGALPAAGSCSFGVRYAPLGAGSSSGNAVVAFTGIAGTRAVALTGSAIEPDAEVSPNSLNFALTPTNSTAAPQSVTLANTGSAELVVSSPTVTGPAAADFTVSSSCPSTLAPGADCSISVTFGPSEVGSRVAQLNVGTDAGARTVALSGEGEAVFDPSAASITLLEVNPVTVVAGAGTPVALTATVAAGGIPANDGTQVTWTSSDGSLAASSTTSAGVASNSWTAPSVAGSYNVTAGIASSGASRSESVTVTPSLATAFVSNLEATPTTLVANGTAASTLAATVQDAYGNLVGEGVTVYFGTTAGALSAGSAITGANSQASVTLTAGITAGVANLTAWVGSTTAASTAVTLSADSSTARVSSVVADVASAPANGLAEVTFTAQVTDAGGNLLEAGHVVTWTTSRGTLLSASSTTNASGEASTRVRAPTTDVAGAVTVTARTGTSAAASASSYFHTQNVVAISQSHTVAAANGTNTILFWADARNEDGSPAVNTPVNWAASVGGFATYTTMTDATGRAANTYTVPTTTGTATIYVRTPSGTMNTSSVTLTYNAATLAPVVTVSHPTMVPTGSNQVEFYATVRDAHGNNPGAGIPVQWSRVGANGWLASGTSATNANGVAAVLFQPYSGITHGVGTQVTATVPPSYATASTMVILQADMASRTVRSLGANYAGAIPRNTQISLNAVIKDQFENGVGAGVAVGFAVAPNVGSFQGLNGLGHSATSGFSTAQAYYTTPNYATTVTITAYTGNGSKTLVLNVQ